MSEEFVVTRSELKTMLKVSDLELNALENRYLSNPCKPRLAFTKEQLQAVQASLPKKAALKSQ